jgi:hypothetical protein
MTGSVEGVAAADAFFAVRPVALSTFRAVHGIAASLGPVTVRTSRSQVAFARRRGFAWLWLPPEWVRDPADVVLSVALGREDASSRWKQVVHPTPRHWMHHLEVRDAAEIDDEVAAWLREAFERAG